jgi:predicted transcriptional regulator YheO
MMVAPATSNTSTKRNVAALPVLPNDANINPQLLSRLQAAVERIATLDGQRGDKLDAALTRRDLVDAGIIKTGGGGNGIEPGDVYVGGGWKDIPYLDSMPTPATPTFKTGIGVNFLFWQLPNARGVGATQIFRRTTNTDGSIISAPVGSMYADLPVDYGVTYYYKIRFVSEKGVAGDWSGEVEVLAEQDPSYALEMMQGKVDSSLLAQGLRERVDVGGTIDNAIAAVSNTLNTETSDLRAAITQVNTDVRGVISSVESNLQASVDTVRVEQDSFAAKSVKEAELAAQTALQAIDEIARVRTEMRDAGIQIDPASGTARIFAIDDTANKTSELAVELDAVKSTLTQKVTYTDVVQAISDAKLDPTQLPEIGDIRGRVTTLESEMDGVQGTLTNKASTTELNATNIRVTTAENNINSLEGQIGSLVGTTDFTNLSTRVSAAESALSSFDGAEIANVVGDLRIAQRSDEGVAEAILNSLLTGDSAIRENASLAQELAFAKETLSAKIDSGISAEAQSRMLLATQIDKVSADLTNSYYTKSTVDEAITEAKTAAISQANGNTATSLSNYYTRANTDAAITEKTSEALSKVVVTDSNGNVLDLNAVVADKVMARANAAASTVETSLERRMVSASTFDSDAETALLNALGTENAARSVAQLSGDLAYYKDTVNTKLVEGELALAEATTVLTSKIDDNAAILKNNYYTKADTDEAISEASRELGATVANNQAALIANYYTKASTDEAITEAKNAAVSQANGNTATMLSNYYTMANTDSAIASSTRSLASKVFTLDANGNPQSLEAGFSESIKTTVDASGVAKATFSSKVTANGRTAGFSYGSDGSISEFYINADRFAVLSYDGSTQTTPFTVSGGKTYIDSAVIKDASITGAKIANATITSANIASLNVMAVAVGGTINSSNYSQAAKTGWAINQDGSAFFGGNTTFGGTLAVNRVGSGAGIDITNDGIRVYDSNGVLRVTIGKLV